MFSSFFISKGLLKIHFYLLDNYDTNVIGYWRQAYSNYRYLTMIYLINHILDICKNIKNNITNTKMKLILQCNTICYIIYHGSYCKVSWIQWWLYYCYELDSTPFYFLASYKYESWRLTSLSNLSDRWLSHTSYLLYILITPIGRFIFSKLWLYGIFCILSNSTRFMTSIT